MTQRWQAWSKRFAALSMRERGLIFAAVAVGIIMGGQALLVDPLMARQAAQQKQMDTQRDELQALQTQRIVLEAEAAASPQHKLLQALQAQLAEQDERLRAAQANLVAAADMPALLEKLLARHHRLQLVSLTSLPAERLDVAAPATAGVPAGSATTEPAAASASQEESAALYRHGVELTVRGSYSELAAYVAELERLPQRLFWQALTMDAQRHPVVELKLKLYTLSLEKSWLAL